MFAVYEKGFVPIYLCSAKWSICVNIASLIRTVGSISFKRWLLGIKNWTWKCNPGRKVCSSVGTISSCLLHRHQSKDLNMWQRQGSGTTCRVRDSFFLLCLSFFWGLLATNNTLSTSLVRRLAILKLVVFTIGAFFQTVCDGVVPKYVSARLWFESDGIGMTGPLSLRCWMLALIFLPLRLMDEYNADSVLGPLALAHAYEKFSGVLEKSDWFSFIFKDNVVKVFRVLEDPGRSSITHPAVSVRFQDEKRDYGLGVALAQVALDRYCHGGTNLFQIPSLAK